MELVIDTGGLDALATRYAGAEAVITQECERAMTETAIFIQSRARENAPKDMGVLTNSIMYEVSPFNSTVTAGTNITYARVMEEGRRPGAPMPPPGSLLPWMGRHGIDLSLEYVIRRAIARKGIVGKRYMQQALEAAQAGPAQNYFNLAVRRAAERLGG